MKNRSALNSLPWFPVLIDTVKDEILIAAPLSAHGLLFRLLGQVWERGSIPTDPAVLSKLIGVAEQEVADGVRHIEHLLESVPGDPSRATFPWLREHLEETQKRKVRRSAAGTKAANARHEHERRKKKAGKGKAPERSGRQLGEPTTPGISAIDETGGPVSNGVPEGSAIRMPIAGQSHANRRPIAETPPGIDPIFDPSKGHVKDSVAISSAIRMRLPCKIVDIEGEGEGEHNTPVGVQGEAELQNKTTHKNSLQSESVNGALQSTGLLQSTGPEQSESVFTFSEGSVGSASFDGGLKGQNTLTDLRTTHGEVREGGSALRDRSISRPNPTSPHEKKTGSQAVVRIQGPGLPQVPGLEDQIGGLLQAPGLTGHVVGLPESPSLQKEVLGKVCVGSESPRATEDFRAHFDELCRKYPKRVRRDEVEDTYRVYRFLVSRPEEEGGVLPDTIEAAVGRFVEYSNAAGRVRLSLRDWLDTDGFLREWHPADAYVEDLESFSEREEMRRTVDYRRKHPDLYPDLGSEHRDAAL